MDKQSIISNVNPKKKKTNRKAAAAKLREESFNQAYKKDKEEQKDTDSHLAEKASQAQKEKEEVSFPNIGEDLSTRSHEEGSETPQEETSHSAVGKETTQTENKAKRGSKKKKTTDRVGEINYSTITVHQNVSKVVKLASTLNGDNMLDFTTDALRHYIKHLKKSGKLPDMKFLDL